MEWVSLSPSLGDLPNPGVEPRSPALRAGSLPAEPQEKPENTGAGGLALLQGNLPDPGGSCIAGGLLTNGSRKPKHIGLFLKLPADGTTVSLVFWVFLFFFFKVFSKIVKFPGSSDGKESA